MAKAIPDSMPIEMPVRAQDCFRLVTLTYLSSAILPIGLVYLRSGLKKGVEVKMDAGQGQRIVIKKEGIAEGWKLTTLDASNSELDERVRKARNPSEKRLWHHERLDTNVAANT